MSEYDDEGSHQEDTENDRYQTQNPLNNGDSFGEEEDGSPRHEVIRQPDRSENSEAWGAKDPSNNPHGGNEINRRSQFVSTERGISSNGRMNYPGRGDGPSHGNTRSDGNSEDEKVSKLDWFIDFVKAYIPYVIYGLGVIVIILYGIILAGSSTNTPGMSNLYLVRVHNKQESVVRKIVNITEATYLASDVSVGIGYFGMCTSSPSVDRNCMGTHGKDGTDLSKLFLHYKDLSTVTLYDLTAHIQRNVFTNVVLASYVFFCLAFCGLIYIQILRTRRREYKTHKFNKKVFLAVMWTGVALAISTAAGSQQAADALQWVGDNGQGILEIQTGVTLLGLQWVIFTFSLCFAVGSRWIYNGHAQKWRKETQRKKKDEALKKSQSGSQNN
ncbi:hypothetical protein GLAREA_10671 [Glarea lozoyensis ATCC 20868]|uniref:Uncharacterized protein n=1 Tax=Glarea lozoyensis (strain ATCC 20868 / MF5171) TaxID=1116229 RepID=S3DSN0_GLAL2|nr:uncharacterized protein GLAREA_10671 [Glarea lozoyensis ATCC 20868]EPE34976.1 hypothetical protein GLAREA_10671 [Glarea lozoyensis ATCC 20868]